MNRVRSRGEPYDPSQLNISQVVVKKEKDDLEDLSTSSEVKPEVNYGVWFAKADGREKCQNILKKIKDRPALAAAEETKVTEQYNKYYIDKTTDARYLLIAIEGVVSKLYRNWKRDLTKTVVYEMLYRYMETHEVILKSEGIKAVINIVKKNSPSFMAPSVRVACNDRSNNYQ